MLHIVNKNIETDDMSVDSVAQCDNFENDNGNETKIGRSCENDNEISSNDKEDTLKHDKMISSF